MSEELDIENDETGSIERKDFTYHFGTEGIQIVGE